MLSVGVPVGIYMLSVFVLYAILLGSIDRLHLLLLSGTLVVLLLAVLLAEAGGSMPLCLVVTALAPVVTVVGYETVGPRHSAAALDRISTQ